MQDAREAPDDEVPASSSFAQWVNLADNQPDRAAQLTIRLVDPDESQQLNVRYRGKDRPTNVLSFTYDDELMQTELVSRPILGDLVICADLVRQEASDRHCPVNDRWAHLTIHGVLHLLGYDHETPQQAHDMESLEVNLLASLNIPNPYEDTDE